MESIEPVFGRGRIGEDDTESLNFMEELTVKFLVKIISKRQSTKVQCGGGIQMSFFSFTVSVTDKV